MLVLKPGVISPLLKLRHDTLVFFIKIHVSNLPLEVLEIWIFESHPEGHQARDINTGSLVSPRLCTCAWKLVTRRTRFWGETNEILTWREAESDCL